MPTLSIRSFFVITIIIIIAVIAVIRRACRMSPAGRQLLVVLDGRAHDELDGCQDSAPSLKLVNINLAHNDVAAHNHAPALGQVIVQRPLLERAVLILVAHGHDVLCV